VSDTQQVGLIGLAVMGQNLVLNMANHGFPVAVFNRTTSKTDDFLAGPAQGKSVKGYHTIEEFIAALEPPRRIIIMVKAGEAVDKMIDQLKPHLGKGDIVLDGGNSLFTDTERRVQALEAEGFNFIGSGISGGEEGALKGPSIMPGGPKKAYEVFEPILLKIAAQTDSGPCCTYIGPRGAGHYVKMVHNGIEYGIIQMIAETYDIMKRGLGMSAKEMVPVFTRWNEGELGGYLMEISVQVLDQAVPGTDTSLVDVILDAAKQKGTGKWTSQNAYDVGVPLPTINEAVTARILSGYKDDRVKIAKTIKPRVKAFGGDRQKHIDMLGDALYCSILMSYTQGMALLRRASDEYDYKLALADIARIWKGGCIIRSKYLDPIMHAFEKKKKLDSLMLNREFARELKRRQGNWRKVVMAAIKSSIPTPVYSASLAYFDGFRSDRLPANVIQGLRDFFGAHQFERIDAEGVWHVEWMARPRTLDRVG
jgi:6-phosphogluconate dehydrogenase